MTNLAIVLLEAILLVPAGQPDRLGTPNEDRATCWVSFSPDGRSIVTTYEGSQTIRLWDRCTGKEILRLKAPPSATFFGGPATFTPDVKMLVGEASSKRNEEIWIWEMPAGKLRKKLTWGQEKESIGSFALSPNGRTLAVLMFARKQGDDHSIRLLDLVTGKEVRVIPWKVPWRSYGRNDALAFSPDGTLLASVGNELIYLWDVTTGKERRRFKGHRHGVNSIAFSPDGKFLASVGKAAPEGGGPVPSWDATIRLWEVASGRTVLVIDVFDPRVNPPGALEGQEFHWITFSPDGRTVASAGDDQTVRIWELISGKELLRFQDGDNKVSCVAYAPDGKVVASAMSNGTAVLWGLAPPGEVVGPHKELEPSDLASRWADLAGADAPKAYRAIWSLSAGPDQTLPFLKERLQPVAKEKPERIRALIATLDSDDFPARERATRELARIGVQAEAALRKTLADTDSQEMRKRIGQLLKGIESWVVSEPETLRTLRAIWVLERIGTPEAKELLKALAGGLPEARVTQDAKAALQRLGK